MIYFNDLLRVVEMRLNFVNQSRVKMPEEFFSLWVECFVDQLRLFFCREKQKRNERKIKNLNKKTLNLIFVSQKKMLALNLKFRKKKKVTDVLSFLGPSSFFFGEIVLCPSYIKGRSHLGFQRDLAYLILHAFLHLLGFEHERNKKEEEKMYGLQDEIFFKNITQVEEKLKDFKRNERKGVF